ncbi:pseudaminic acid synthase [Paenibacillus eucommiae]|uniref:Pseudaminic acid synthase n=1 Tax=Paenibacillus eucommiae TaxID=1355755 RepID=A0ABS4J2A9_9BACL|nr:pseudaminic acid synthase [Paenibacillus eucommiae]MBP1993969.1 pseudaminic acid synthase [Paenibacillus eucommiae]
MREIQLGGRKVGREYPPLIIAEMSGNHNQSLEAALSIVDAAAEAGAHALKLQTYTADLMTLNLEHGDFHIGDPDSLWKGQSLYKLYEQAYTPWEWHKPIFERCRQKGIIPFSTPFHRKAVDYLEQLDVPFYKIASFENNDIPLIQYAAATGKPLIISTGMATLAELEETVKAAREAGCTQLVLLKCTSSYPATPADSNINTIPHMRELFDCEVGLSDHTLGIGVAVASVALGASVIEKHFTLSRADGGVDAAFSLEPEEMRQLVSESERAWQAMGKICYERTEKEASSLKFRRSLYISQDMGAGDTLSEENVRIVRPGYGLAPKYIDLFLGKKVSKAAKAGTPLSWDIL